MMEADALAYGQDDQPEPFFITEEIAAEMIDDSDFIYLDNVMFSGNRVGNDLEQWIVNTASSRGCFRYGHGSVSDPRCKRHCAAFTQAASGKAGASL